MPTAPRHSSLYQINARVWLECLSRRACKRITLADIDDATIDGFAGQNKGPSGHRICIVYVSALAHVDGAHLYWRVRSQVRK